MLILKPKVHSTIWGGNALKEFYPENNNIGHLYSCVPYGEFDNEIIYPKAEEGKTLGAYLKSNPQYKNCFPYAVAIVTPQLDLSIQVHPPRGIEGDKNESWIFLTPPTQGTIYSGCNTQNKQELSDAIESETLMRYVNKVSINKGDYTYIQGGTLHAMTAGSIVYEIEEIGGITCRLYDYGRRDADGKLRPLQIQQGLEYLQPQQTVCVQENCVGKTHVEDRYTVQYLDCVEVFENHRTIPVCVTVLGVAFVNGIQLNYGTSVVVFPQELLELGGCACVIACANIE